VVGISDALFISVNVWYPRRDSNPRTWLRRPELYPLSYGGWILDIMFKTFNVWVSAYTYFNLLGSIRYRDNVTVLFDAQFSRLKVPLFFG
jgi:hypothetical protein